MIRDLYKKENNIFQSDAWLDFQKDSGRKIIDLGGKKALLAEVKFGKNFAWVQKDNIEFPVSEKAVFVRVEPSSISEAEVRKLGLIKVGPDSLLAGQKSPKATRVLDISMTEDEILAQMKSKTRYNIRLAEKKGIKVTCVDDANILYNLLKKTSGRDKGYSPHGKTYYDKMAQALCQKGFGKVFVAECKGEPLAAIFVTFYGKLSIYLHGGFDDSKRNLMAPYLCQWEAIKYAKTQGCHYYDFWGVAETDDPKDPWAGISRFKEGFGGEKIIFPGSYDYVLHPFWYNLLTLLAKIKHLVR